MFKLGVECYSFGLEQEIAFGPDSRNLTNQIPSLFTRGWCGAITEAKKVGKVMEIGGKPSQFRQAKLLIQHLFEMLGCKNGGSALRAATQDANGLGKPMFDSEFLPVFQIGFGLANVLEMERV